MDYFDYYYEQVLSQPKSFLATFVISIIALTWIYSEINYYRIKKLTRTSGPRPWPLLGHMHLFFLYPRAELTKYWQKKYGKIFLLMMGSKPRIGISDIDVMKQIFIKDFDNFPNHHADVAFVDRFLKETLIFLKDDHWKRVRAMLSPTFTSSKIKIMFNLLDTCADDLVENISDHMISSKNSEIICTDVNQKTLLRSRKIFDMYTLDGIATCCYALKLGRRRVKIDDNQNGASPRNEFVNKLDGVLRPDMTRMLILLILPKFLHKYVGESRSTKILAYLEEKISKIIEDRRQNSKTVKYDDYLQILLEAKIDDSMVLTDIDKAENHHVGHLSESLISEHEKLKADISVDNNSPVVLQRTEMMANALFLLVVGLETTANSLTSITYCLAKHQDIQTKLYEEIKKIATKDNNDGTYKFDYETLTRCSYLDSVISESLRIMTPISAIDRHTKEDYVIEKYDVLIPADSVIFLDYLLIHTSEEFWPNPYKFDPERFMPENRDKIVPGSYSPFGQGPRHCLGMRFSLTETKIAIAKLLMNYKFTSKPGSKWPPKFIPGVGPSKFKDIDVFVERRHV